ncbi:MAG: DUF3320 domain-containing protein, partial [Steroidobacteraceae bacterium]
RDRNSALRAILRSVEQALGEAPVEEADRSASTAPPKPHESEGNGNRRTQPNPEEPRRSYSPGVPYRKYRPSRTRDSAGILSCDRVSELASQVASVARAEGPIHQDILLDRLKEIYGVSRAGSNIQDNVRLAIAIAVRHHGIRHDARGGFLYFGVETVECFRIDDDGVGRSIVQIAPEEIALAVLFAVEDQFGFPRDHLPRAVAELFGIGKATVGVAEVVGTVVDTLVERQRLRLSGPNVYLP